MITPVGATLDPDPSAFFKSHYPAVYRFVSATTGAPD